MWKLSMADLSADTEDHTLAIWMYGQNYFEVGFLWTRYNVCCFCLLFFLTINASRTLSVVNYVVAFNGGNSRNVTLVRSECRRAELRNCRSWSEKEKVISAILRARQQHKLNLSANFTDLDQFYFRTANENSGGESQTDYRNYPILNINNAANMKISFHLVS